MFPALVAPFSNLPDAAAAELLFYFISFISHNLQDPHLYCTHVTTAIGYFMISHHWGLWCYLQGTTRAKIVGNIYNLW